MLEPANRLEVGAQSARRWNSYSPSSGNVVAHTDAADGAERQPFEVLALRLIARACSTFPQPGAVVGSPTRQRAHAIGGDEVALEQRR